MARTHASTDSLVRATARERSAKDGGDGARALSPRAGVCSSRGNRSVDKVAHDVLGWLLESCLVVDFDFKYVYANDAAMKLFKAKKLI